MSVYYNENDPKSAAWLRELIFEGHIAWGEVDERSIEDIRPSELAGYTQCHFFAGIGGWSYALRLAGWPDDRPVWTGSCPCQPFSAAGKAGGFADERHLWPAWHHLIRECKPAVVFGEQVASKDGLKWFDLVHTDLEDAGYAVGAADLCAAGVGAPHIRQRLYFVAESGRQRLEGLGLHVQSRQARLDQPEAGRRGEACELGDPGEPRSGRDAGAILGEESRAQRSLRRESDEPQPASVACELADTDGGDTIAERKQRSGQYGLKPQDGGAFDRMEHAESDGRIERRPESSERSAVGGRGESLMGDPDDAGPQGRRVRWDGTGERAPWTADLVGCRDGKWRPVEPGTFPLAHGIPGRVGLLRGYGNAIVPQVAAAFIQAYGDVT